MQLLPFFDNHVHSTFSPDSSIEMARGIEAAIERGLTGLCFSDHYDFDPPPRALLLTFDPAARLKEFERLSSRCGPLKLLQGIEVGMQPKSLETIRSFMETYSFDQVIASMHFIDNCDPYYGGYYERYTEKEAYRHYLEAIWECISQWDNFDILGHFDYITRYSPYRGHCLTYREYSDLLDPILQLLAHNGKSLEINMRTYMPFKHGTPEIDRNVLRRFKELGGEAISLGSDAHHTSRIGERFEFAAHLIHSCGFNYTVHYEHRKPHFLRIP